MSRLISYELSPPGGFYFKQGNRNFAGPVIQAIAQEVAAYRSSNGLPRATFPDALQDVDEYQCQRLGNNPRWCTGTGVVRQFALAQNAPGLAPCASCGAKVE